MTNKSYQKNRERYLDSAKAFQKSYISQSNRLEIRHQNPDLIQAVRDGLKKIKGRSMAEKILFLLQHYREHSPSPNEQTHPEK